jgi:puromycin-sensitive aminopeptidase
VTMEWWNDVWLNESFASLMADLSLAALQPEWPIPEISEAATQRAMATDALLVAHAVHDVPETGPGTAQFAELIYSKGEAVLRMMAHYVGEENFRQGVHHYLTAHALGNAREEDLWDALGTASHEDIGPLAHSWLNQAGVPLVTFLRKPIPSLRQQRFSPLGSTAQQWQVPVCVRAGSGSACSLLAAAEAPLDRPPAAAGGPANPGWLDANAGAFGYYRVRYDPESLALLRKALRDGKLTGAERLALLADQWWLMRAGLEDLGPTLQIVADLRNDPSSAVTGQVLAVLNELNLLLSPDEQLPFRKMVTKLFGSHCQTLGWEPRRDEPPDRRELRAALLNAMDLLGEDRKISAEGQRRLAAWEAAPQSLDPSLLPTVLAIGARHGDSARWGDYRARIRTAPTPEVRLRLEQALGQFRDRSLLTRTLELTLSAGPAAAGALPAQDVGYVYASLFANPAARSQAWAFLSAHWSELSAELNPYLLERQILPGVAQLCSAAERDQVATLFQAHPLKSGTRMVQRVLENIDLCLKVQRAQAANAPAAIKAMTAELGSAGP